MSAYRPPNWSNQTAALFSITATLPNSASNNSNVSDLSSDELVADKASSPTTYIFDAVLRSDHYQELRRTEHPVQSGASIIDHAYLLPGRLILEIGMSDAMDSYVAGQWTSASTKSVSAYQTLELLQSLRIPLKVATKLRTYENMLIDVIQAQDSYRTRTSLRATVSFGEIKVGNVSVTSNSVSARPNSTGSTNQGTANPETLSPQLQGLVDQVIHGMQ